MVIRNRLLISFLAIASLVALLGAIAYRSNIALLEEISRIKDSSIPEAEGAAGMSEALMQVQASLRELLLRKVAKVSDPGGGQAGGGLTDSAPDLRAALGTFESRLAATRAGVETGLGFAVAHGETEDGDQEKEELRQLASIEENFKEYRRMCLEIQGRPEIGPEKVDEILRQLDRYEADHLLPLVFKYRLNPQEELHRDLMEAKDHVEESNITLLIAVVATLVGGLTLGWLVSRSILNPIGRLMKGSERMAQGHLEEVVEDGSHDELGALASTFNRMVKDLRSTMVSKSYVDGIITSIPDLLFVLGPDHTIQTLNRAAEQFLEYQEAELLGRPLASIVELPPIELAGLLGQISEAGFVRSVELNYLSRAGVPIPVSFSASVLKNASGATQGMVCIAQDIRARKKAEAELEQAQKALIETSRKAGMAEVATSVLHNVGNVLNSVNVSATLVGDQLRSSKIGNVGRVAALLSEHMSDPGAFFTLDPRGKELPNYLSQLAARLETEKGSAEAELESLHKNVEHIKHIIAMQQSYAKVSGVVEVVDLRRLLEDALRMHAAALQRHGVAVVRDFEEVPPIRIEKHKLLQILVNLVHNAKYACDEGTRSDRCLTVRLAKKDQGVTISLTDNGVGILQENLTRIFSHGFTTRKNGHGFGLHSGALAAKELGGALSVSSAGLGHGATFTIDLPMEPARPNAV